MTERIPVHVTVSLCDRGTMAAFRNRWRKMPEPTRDRFREVTRAVVQLRLGHLTANHFQRKAWERAREGLAPLRPAVSWPH